MDSNPFEAPTAQPEPAPVISGSGQLDIGLAYREGWETCRTYFGTWLLGAFLSAFVFILSMVTIVGWIVVGPVLFWGAIRFTLNARDGRAEFRDWFSGFSNFGQSFLPMVGLCFLLLVAQLPGQIAGAVAQFSDNTLLSTVGHVFSYGWGVLVMAFLYLSPFFVVERGLGPLEAIQQSLAATLPQRNNVLLFSVSTMLVILAGLIALLVGVFPATFIVYAAWASAYRQLAVAPTSASVL